MNVDKTNLIAQIAKIEATIATYTISIEDSKAASDRMCELFKLDDFTPHVEEIKALAGKGALINDTRALAAFNETLNADLMKISTRYVVTNTDSLISPAGFHPDEKVYLQTAIAIHTDSLKRIPSSNRTLYAHKMKTGGE